jgi:hypothetical protein
VRGRHGFDGGGDSFIDLVRRALDGIVESEAIIAIRPSLEDVFVLHGDSACGQAYEKDAA